MQKSRRGTFRQPFQEACLYFNSDQPGLECRFVNDYIGTQLHNMLSMPQISDCTQSNICSRPIYIYCCIAFNFISVFIAAFSLRSALVPKRVHWYTAYAREPRVTLTLPHTLVPRARYLYCDPSFSAIAELL